MIKKEKVAVKRIFRASFGKLMMVDSSNLFVNMNF